MDVEELLSVAAFGTGPRGVFLNRIDGRFPMVVVFFRDDPNRGQAGPVV